MHRFLFFGSVLALFWASQLFAQTVKTGTISASETWSGNITVTGKVTITGGTVTISPGAVISVADSMGIYVKKGGALQAVGTELNPILFTSTSASPTAGKWDRISLDSNSTQSRFSYCTIQYAGDGINLHTSSPAISYCTIASIKGSGVFGDGGSAPSIDHCTFRSCGISIFFNTVGTISITYTTIYNTSCGIVLAGSGSENITVNHCTIALVDMRLATGQWWTGYGIYCANTGARLTLTNTIISFGTVATANTQYGFNAGAWTVTRDYNCWYGGKGAIESGTPATHDQSADPVFVNFSGGDLRLRNTSTCLFAGSDGLHLGAWQGTPAQDVVIFSGRVTDSQTSSGVGQVVVLVKNTTNQTATDNNGYFTLYDLPTGIVGAGYDLLDARPGIFVDQAQGAVRVQSAGRAHVTLYDATGRSAGLARQAAGWYVLPRTTGMFVVEAELGNQTYYAKALALDGAWRLENFVSSPANHQTINAKAAATATLVFSKNGYDLKEQDATVGDLNVAASIVNNGTGGYLWSDFTDTVLAGSYVDNYAWRASTATGTGGNLFTLANLQLTGKYTGDPTGSGYVHMKVPAGQMQGAELICTQETGYGYYEVRMKCSNVWGACNAFFWINMGTSEEIDCEFLTPEFYNQPSNVGRINCMLHPNGGGSAVNLSFNPSAGFHRIGFLWRSNLLQWTADGVVIKTVSDANQVPRNPGKMFFNNWTGNANWGGGPPTTDNIMVVDWMRFHPGATTIVVVPTHLQR